MGDVARHGGHGVVRLARFRPCGGEVRVISWRRIRSIFLLVFVRKWVIGLAIPRRRFARGFRSGILTRCVGRDGVAPQRKRLDRPWRWHFNPH